MTKPRKILWFVPPPSRAGFPNVGQNRFFKNMSVRTNIVYPYLEAMGVTQLKKAGFNVEYADCCASGERWEQLEPKLKEADLIFMEGRTPMINYVFECCDAIKGLNPGCKIALYGDHVTWDSYTALDHCNFVVAGGDYDYGALQLAKRLQAGLEHSPAAFNFGLVADLDTLPFVDHEEAINWRNYYEAGRTRDTFLWTMSGRGCRFPCTFCSWGGTLWDHTVRQRSPLNVATELKELYERYGNYEILDDHDCFDTAWGVKFAKQLIDFGFSHREIKWGIQTHSSLINNLEDLKLMKKAGLFWAKLGIESGNQETLNRIRKCVTIEQHERAVELLKKADVLVHLNLMVGWPWETREMAYHTIEWVKKLKPNQAQFSLVIPYPNAPLYEEALENGWLTVGARDWDRYDACYPMLKMEGLTSDEVVQLYQDHWREFYFDPKYILRHLLKVRTKQDVKILYRGFRSVYYGHMRATRKLGAD